MSFFSTAIKFSNCLPCGADVLQNPADRDDEAPALQLTSKELHHSWKTLIQNLGKKLKNMKIIYLNPLLNIFLNSNVFLVLSLECGQKVHIIRSTFSRILGNSKCFFHLSLIIKS